MHLPPQGRPNGGGAESLSAAGEPAHTIARPPAPPKNYRWVLAEPPGPFDTAAIEQQSGVHPVVARVLGARGWSAGSDLGDFLDPLLKRTHDPFLMKGMKEATERLLRAIHEREPVVIYGDYDVDGSSATALLVRLFRFLNVPVQWYVPSRLLEGYGLHINAMMELSRCFRLIVTVDTGITAVKEAEWARSHGIDLIISDHHRPGDQLPSAVAIVNPNQPDCPYPDKSLAGVGVAFKLAHGVLKALNRDPDAAREFLRQQLDLVAMGTICDLMPLVGENRALVRYGLQQLQEARRPGLKALKVVCGFEHDKPLMTHHLGYGLGPRLNAAGRTANPSVAVELLVTEDELRAFELAEELEKLNDERRRIERRIVDEVLLKILEDCDIENDRVIVCGGSGWHLGVIGIVASRILDRYHRPTIICAIEEDVAQGSGRSIESFDLHSALGACEHHLTQFGGHAHAAGVRLPAGNLRLLREALNHVAGERLHPDDMIPKLHLDALIEPHEVTPEVVQGLDALAPHGHGNKPPLFLMQGMALEGPPRTVGTNHLKLHVRRDCGSRPIEVIGFNLGHYMPLLAGGVERVDLAGIPRINEFRNIRTMQFEIRDLRPTPSGA